MRTVLRFFRPVDTEVMGADINARVYPDWAASRRTTFEEPAWTPSSS